MAFRGYGNDRVVHVFGHVPGADAPTTRRSLANRFRDLRQQPARRIRLQVGGDVASAQIDPQGHYNASLSIETADVPADGDIDVAVVADIGHGSVTSTHRVTRPSRYHDLIVVVDLDDTLLPYSEFRTTARDLSELVRRVWCGPPHAPRRPVIYLTRRPWRRYYSLKTKLGALGMPDGPLLMEPDNVSVSTVMPDKSDHLHAVLDTYPQTPLVIIGPYALLSGESTGQRLLAEGARIRAILVPHGTPEIGGACSKALAPIYGGDPASLIDRIGALDLRHGGNGAATTRRTNGR